VLQQSVEGPDHRLVVGKIVQPAAVRAQFTGCLGPAQQQYTHQSELGIIELQVVVTGVAEGLRVHGVKNANERFERSRKALELVGLNEKHMQRFPHEFSGGQRQRIGIARALVLDPTFIVADEPVSALDVSIQSQVLNLLKDLQQELNLTLLFIAHDMSVVEHLCDRVAVMYLGKIVEVAERDELFQNPQHPYTRALLSAIPVPDPTARRERIILQGDVPSPLNPPPGCSFHTRCPEAIAICSKQEPQLKDLRNQHFCSCLLREPEETVIKSATT